MFFFNRKKKQKIITQTVTITPEDIAFEKEVLRQKLKEDEEYKLVTDGQFYEKEGEIALAIDAYEQLIIRRFDGTLPYDRLAILYRKQKNYQSEKR